MANGNFSKVLAETLNTEDKIFIDNDLGNWYEVYDLLNELNIYAMPTVETLLDKYGSAQ